MVAQLAILFECDLISCRLPWLSQGAFVDPGRCWFGSVFFNVCISLQEGRFIMGQEEELKCGHLSTPDSGLASSAKITERASQSPWGVRDALLCCVSHENQWP